MINEYFLTLKLLETDKDLYYKFLFQEKPLSQIALFEWLPTLYFAKSFKKEIASKRFRGLKQFLKSRAKDVNVSKASITTTVNAIQIVKKMVELDEKDIAKYRVYKKVASQTILNRISRFKFKIILKSENREKIEAAFAKAENLKTTQGNITFMLLAQQDVEKVKNLKLKNFEINAFCKLIEIVKLSFDNHSDLMRRALFTFGFYDKHHGYTTSLSSDRYSLGNSPQYYGEIANDFNYDFQNTIFKYLIAAQKLKKISLSEIKRWMQDIVYEYKCSDDDIYQKIRCKLIKKKKLLNAMTGNFYCVSYDESRAYILYKQKVTGERSYKKIV